MARADYNGATAAVLWVCEGHIANVNDNSNNSTGQQTTTITELNETKRRHTCNSNAYSQFIAERKRWRDTANRPFHL